MEMEEKDEEVLAERMEMMDLADKLQGSNRKISGNRGMIGDLVSQLLIGHL